MLAGRAYYEEGISDSLFDKGLCLPSGSILTEEDRMRVVEIIRLDCQNKEIFFQKRKDLFIFAFSN
jgi:dTDP-4-amino-4,6-dideoxygalactose transaminase